MHTGLKYPPQLDSPFLPEAMFFVFVLGSPLVNKDLQYPPPIRQPHFGIGQSQCPPHISPLHFANLLLSKPHALQPSCLSTLMLCNPHVFQPSCFANPHVFQPSCFLTLNVLQLFASPQTYFDLIQACILQAGLVISPPWCLHTPD